MKTVKEVQFTVVEAGTVTTAKGFYAAGVSAGLRYTKKDVGAIYSVVPAVSAAVYTTSSFQAAPIHVTKDSLAQGGVLQAIVVNSACANACTGERGLQDAYTMRRLGAEQFNVLEHHVAVASTGVIGEFLPMEKLAAGIAQLSATKDGDEAFQTAILTTDLVMKTACAQVEIDGVTVTIGGASKGSGMIHPNMATMLGFMTTDVSISEEALTYALKQATNQSFNQITVDGETSTNDMVVVMANGEAGNEPLTLQHPQWTAFYEAFLYVSQQLAKAIARDGEGATKLIEVVVHGAVTTEEANAAAKKIVGSSLVKTAVYGADANWGRIIGALGHSGATVDVNNVDVYLGEIAMLKGSEPQSFSEEAARAYLEGTDVQITVHLHSGEASGKAWGCDLSYDYVKINASYRT